MVEKDNRKIILKKILNSTSDSLKSLYEVKLVLDAFPDEEKRLINQSVYELLENKLSGRTYDVTIDFGKPLRGQISDQAMIILAYIVRKLFNEGE